MSRSKYPGQMKQPSTFQIILLAVAILVVFFIAVAPLLAAADPLIR